MSDFEREVLEYFIDESQQCSAVCVALDESTKAAILLLLPRSKRFWTYFSD